MNSKQARFELRLNQEDKLFFEQASQLAGFKTLSSFVLTALRSYATKVFQENEKILISQKEKETFFDAVFSNAEPNDALKKATTKYLKTDL